MSSINIVPIEEYPDKAELFSGLARLDNLTYERDGTTFSNERWTEKHFEFPLPEKFALSLVALTDRQILGYCIASRKGSYRHIHRFVAQSEVHNKVGQLLLATFLERGAAPVTLLVNQMNGRAIRFYKRNGFHAVKSSDEIKELVGRQDLRMIGDRIVITEDYRCLLMVRD